MASENKNATIKKPSGESVGDVEETFRMLVESIKEYAIIKLDTEGRVASWNAGAARIKGYEANEIIGKHFSVFFPREAIALGKPQRALAEAAAKGRYEDEGWRVRKDGSQFWALTVLSPLRNEAGGLSGFVKITRDYTERRKTIDLLNQAKIDLERRIKEQTAEASRIHQEFQRGIIERLRTEQQLRTSHDQLRALAARLETAREAERTRLSREIHDELGQALTAIKMDIVHIASRLPQNPSDLRAQANATIHLVDESIRTVRRIASELRPGVLDDLGLVAAIEFEVEAFQKRTGAVCQASLPQQEIPIEPDCATAVFRILQETLTNVARHAAATRVSVRLQIESGDAILEIRDNGKGFDESRLGGEKTLGLLGMKERASALGGEFKISSNPGAGTTVLVRIPLRPPA